MVQAIETKIFKLRHGPQASARGGGILLQREKDSRNAEELLDWL